MKVERLESLTSVEEIIPLLLSCELDVTDLIGNSRVQFFIIREQGKVIATVALEGFASVGLLRSMAVAPARRNSGLANTLLSHLESAARAQGITALYLLTTRAVPYFSKRGYCLTSRSEAPDAIKASAQFSSLCPVSAALMSKTLNG